MQVLAPQPAQLHGHLANLQERRYFYLGPMVLD